MDIRFAERLKELRTNKKLSFIQLSKEVGISDASLCRWENGTTDIKLQAFIKLAEYFNVTLDYLAGLE